MSKWIPNEYAEANREQMREDVPRVRKLLHRASFRRFTTYKQKLWWVSVVERMEERLCGLAPSVRADLEKLERKLITKELGFEAKELPREAGVYFLQSADLVKIGYSKDIRTRLQGRGTFSSHGDDMQLIAWEPGGREREAELHAIFSAKRRKGEWFALEGPISEYLRERLSQNSTSTGAPS